MTYSKRDFKKALKQKKHFMFFQYIEGTDGKYFAHDEIDQITEFLVFAYAKILTASNLEETKIDEYE